MLRSLFVRTTMLALCGSALMLSGCASRGSVSQLKENLAQTQREADRNAAAAALAQQTAQQAAIAAQSGQANNAAAAAAASQAALANQKAEQALREANEARSAAAAAPAPEPSVDTVTVIEDTVKKPVVKTIGHKNVKRKRIIHHHHHTY